MRAADAWTVADPTVCPICGRDACEDHLPPDPETPPTGGLPASLTFARALDVMTAPSPVEIIEGLAWANCLSVLVSESGGGKTFVLLDAAAAVSDGIPWHGRATREGSVAYVSFEGDALGLRLRALSERAGRQLENLYIVSASDPISPRVTREGEERSIGEVALSTALDTLARELAAAQRPPIVLVIIDTVRASLAGSEDSSEHVAAYLRAVRRLMACVPGAACILAHHAGWQDGDAQRKRERGSSAWRGNCDATFYLDAGEYDRERGKAPLTLRALKVRDADRPAPLHLIRRRVELAERDRYGEPVTSCVIERDSRTHEDRAAEAQAVADRAQGEIDLKTLRTIVDHAGIATSQDRLRVLLGVRKAVVSDSLRRLMTQGWVTPGRRNQAYIVTDAGRAALETPA